MVFHLVDLAPSLEDRAKIRLFRTFDLRTDSDQIPDPYGGPEEGYDETIDQVIAAAHGLIDTLRSGGVQDSVTFE